ncbi:MAG: hypothetical protein QF781_10240, partial [Phycisphaerales bacterium]|nr:hypothetical protein [Phycisphaerales bacterium]
ISVKSPSCIMRDLRHLKNNTPVNTEVLWGGGLWWGLWAGAPAVHDREKIVGTNSAITINIRILAAPCHRLWLSSIGPRVLAHTYPVSSGV